MTDVGRKLALCCIALMGAFGVMLVPKVTLLLLLIFLIYKAWRDSR